MAVILAVPWTALFWTEILDVVPRICRSYSPSPGVTATSVVRSIILNIMVILDLNDFFELVFSQGGMIVPLTMYL